MDTQTKTYIQNYYNRDTYNPLVNKATRRIKYFLPTDSDILNKESNHQICNFTVIDDNGLSHTIHLQQNLITTEYPNCTTATVHISEGIKHGLVSCLIKYFDTKDISNVGDFSVFLQQNLPKYTKELTNSSSLLQKIKSIFSAKTLTQYTISKADNVINDSVPNINTRARFTFSNLFNGIYCHSLEATHHETLEYRKPEYFLRLSTYEMRILEYMVRMNNALSVDAKEPFYKVDLSTLAYHVTGRYGKIESIRQVCIQLHWKYMTFRYGEIYKKSYPVHVIDNKKYLILGKEYINPCISNTRIDPYFRIFEQQRLKAMNLTKEENK